MGLAIELAEAVASELSEAGVSRSLKKDIRSKGGTVLKKGTSVTLSWPSPSVTKVSDASGNYVNVRTSRLHLYVKGIAKPPSAGTMEKWIDNGVAKTVTGKRTEPDGEGPDGSPSWILALDMV